MTQSGCKLENHLLILALTGILFLVTGPPTAQATGCHVPERPVLARSLSWEVGQQPGFSRFYPRAAPAPAVIVPVPCQGETPTLQSFVSGLASADFAPGRYVGKLEPSGRHADCEAPALDPTPRSSRLDRPPRRGPARQTMA